MTKDVRKHQRWKEANPPMINLNILDGPARGRIVRYSLPLPKILVVAEVTKDELTGMSRAFWHDYVPETLGWRHSRKCKCQPKGVEAQ